MKLFIIINGIETEIDCKSFDTILQLAEIALEQTKGEPRPEKPVHDWLLIYNDQTMNLNKRVMDHYMKDGEVIFMTLKAGEGA